jgi:hypothetical protein
MQDTPPVKLSLTARCRQFAIDLMNTSKDNVWN